MGKYIEPLGQVNIDLFFWNSHEVDSAKFHKYSYYSKDQTIHNFLFLNQHALRDRNIVVFAFIFLCLSHGLQLTAVWGAKGLAFPVF